MCCETASHFICQILAPGESQQAYYRYLYFFQCLHCKSPSVYRAQLSKINPYFAEEERKIPAEDEWNTETTTEAIESLLLSPELQENYCDMCIDIFEEDPKVTEVAKKLFTADLRDELVITDVLESMEGNAEGKISQGGEQAEDDDDDDDDDDLEEFAEDKANRDVSFEVFRWFNDFHSKSPVIRYGRNIVPLWYSDRDRPALVPSPCRCGAMRTFECQVLPQIISAVKGCELDFGGIFTYTCPNSCEVQGYAAEEAFYQPSL